ncbi:MAG: DUF3842 family protein [Eubacteriales bacterium]
MKIVIVDGQGGRLGKLFVEEILKKIPDATIFALGTNSIATATMLKAGAHHGATGENPIVRNLRDADAVFGAVGIVVAHAILGEVTPVIAEAVGGASATKFLVPMNGCGVVVSGVSTLKLQDYVEQAVATFLESK